jgi:hypothetical protein
MTSPCCLCVPPNFFYAVCIVSIQSRRLILHITSCLILFCFVFSKFQGWIHGLAPRLVGIHALKLKHSLPPVFFFWFVRLLTLRPLLAYCASLG